MVRKLKHHEQKLLRKVDFTTYRSTDPTHRSATICRRYAISQPADYTKYNRLAGSLKQLAHYLSLLPPDDPVRFKYERLLLEKLDDMGILSLPSTTSTTSGTDTMSKSMRLSEVPRKLTASRFARRRLGVVMTRLGMAGTVQASNKFIEQGHVRVGTEVVTDPAYLVTRGMEDFVTWVDGSKIKRHIQQYREELDDFDLI